MALRAVCAAAEAERVDPARLSAAAYRRFRADDAVEALPSDVTIALLFGGWHHACALAHDAGRPPEEVEDAVRATLYGDRSHVERVGLDA